jgi:hypothetical protein
MARETRTIRRIQGEDGVAWEVSEAYAWEPLRQAEPSAHLVFRAAGREVTAQPPAPLAEMDDARLAVLLASALALADAHAERAATPMVRQTRPPRIAGSLHLFPAFAAGG